MILYSGSQDNALFDAILKGISKSGLKESLQNICLITRSSNYANNQYNQGKPGNFEYDMTEKMKKYGLEKIALKCG